MKKRQIKIACATNTDEIYTQTIEQYMPFHYTTN